MLCPVCKTALVISERQGIEIDYCPQCRGVWLDRSELDRIIERSAAALAVPNREMGDQRSYAEPARHESEARKHPDDRQHYSDDKKYYDDRKHYGDDKYYGDKRHYRKKSLLSELFDF